VLRLARFICIVAAGLAVLASAQSAHAFDAGLEAKNFAKILERQVHVTLSPEFQLEAQEQEIAGPLQLAEILANDPERNPLSLCAQRQGECIGDIRYYDWEESGAGKVREVLWTSRSGATVSGRVWATDAGPLKRPGIVITTGSVQAPETLYWPLAATLAKHGYVVLTYDVQGQGRSDTFGEAPDEQENFPFQQPSGFVDGTEDALDFLLSRPDRRYRPRKSCTSGTSHAAKQRRRVEEGLNAAFNPFWRLVDRQRIGIAGHSLGARAVSFVGQKDPRVDAIAAWDNLGLPTKPSNCASAPATRTDTQIAKPALGISNDYGIVQTPFTEDPNPEEKNTAFHAYREAGVDSMELTIRGGSHEESAFIPGRVAPVPLGSATLRGQELIGWYTTAWFDKYVKCPGAASAERCEARADRRLATSRWRDDEPGQAVDLNGDGNLFSFYFRSRMDVAAARGDGRLVCDDLRTGCPVLRPDADAKPYSMLADAHRPDG
jgi:dienelactone hydrolase